MNHVLFGFGVVMVALGTTYPGGHELDIDIVVVFRVAVFDRETLIETLEVTFLAIEERRCRRVSLELRALLYSYTRREKLASTGVPSNQGGCFILWSPVKTPPTDFSEYQKHAPRVRVRVVPVYRKTCSYCSPPNALTRAVGVYGST